MLSSSWRSFLPQPLRIRTLEIISMVAERLCVPEKTLSIAEIAAKQTSMPVSPNPVLLTFGSSGPALTCAYLDRCFPDQGWDRVAHHYLDTSKLSEMLRSPSLYGGTSGLGFILNILSCNGTRYQKALAQLNQHLCDLVLQPSGLWSNIHAMEKEYDLISGATGILTYLITLHSEESCVQAAIEHLLSYLILLADNDNETQRERWYIPPENLIGEDKRQAYPGGYYNCGLAHGIPGPMAVLALAWLEGYRLPDQREALLFLSDWLLQYALSDTWGINWADAVPLSATRFPNQWKQHCPPTRAAWCYGAPGISRALWLTGLALEKPDLCLIAIQALEAVLQRPIYYRNIDSPTLCHGIAGLLEICLRFGNDTDNPTIREHISLLVKQIIDLFNPNFPFGFRDQERPLVFIDQPAWLTGASGILLTLLAAALPVEPIWDRIMLLS